MLALGGAVLASGCVAAAAIPVIAGGAIAGRDAIGGASDSDRPEAPAEATADNEADLVPAGEPVPGQLPRPATIATTEVDPYAGFAAYASDQARPYLPTETRQSVVLADPGSLSPATRPCKDQPPAVLLDLDREDENFDPSADGKATGTLPAALASLRQRGLSIIWLTGAPIAQRNAIAARLKSSQLDPEGADVLALPAQGERKQSLRARLVEQYCIEAMAGDRRADFDELYDYLRNPNSAIGLETLIGKGWFLVPPPIEAGGNS